MELILQGWLDRDSDDNIRINETKYSDNLSEKIMNYFNYESIDVGLGKKRTIIDNANLRMWFSDEECTLEEAQMNFDCYMETGRLFTQGSYIGYSEWTITGFDVEDLTISSHDLDNELDSHIGQYCHLILTD